EQRLGDGSYHQSQPRGARQVRQVPMFGRCVSREANRPAVLPIPLIDIGYPLPLLTPHRKEPVMQQLTKRVSVHHIRPPLFWVIRNSRRTIRATIADTSRSIFRRDSRCAFALDIPSLVGT